jgi:hypothetical protein
MTSIVVNTIMDVFWIIKINFSLFGKNWQEINKKTTQLFWYFFGYVPCYGQKCQNGLWEYIKMNCRHFLLNCNQFWWSSNFWTLLYHSDQSVPVTKKLRRTFLKKSYNKDLKFSQTCVLEGEVGKVCVCRRGVCLCRVEVFLVFVCVGGTVLPNGVKVVVWELSQMFRKWNNGFIM